MRDFMMREGDSLWKKNPPPAPTPRKPLWMIRVIPQSS